MTSRRIFSMASFLSSLWARGKPIPVLIHTGVWFQSYLVLDVWSPHWRWKHRLSTEEDVPILLLQLGP